MPERVFAIETAGPVWLAGEQAGEGPPIVLLHGLTATRRYVVMGSRVLERSGHRVIAYDARGHGRSSPAPSSGEYTYELLAGDLLAVLDGLQIERAVLAGASMGAHTALRFALDHPLRVRSLGLITPAFDPEARDGEDAESKAGPGGEGAAGEDAGEDAGRDGAGGEDGPGDYEEWDRLARGLRQDGVEGFVAAYDLEAVPERWRDTVLAVLRQRLSAHEHPLAVADALEAVPRSRPFEAWADLGEIAVPTLVVGSRDEADPGHPLSVAERYASAIPHARLLVEDAGPPAPPTPPADSPAGSPARSPLAWQGGQLSKALLSIADS